jgi:arylsulfatase A-like enzyme/Tfp pilus assembly protein PilF
MSRFLCVVAAALVLAACRDAPARGTSASVEVRQRPSVLLVTLDTTRADAVGPEAVGVQTPAFDAIAARGLRFRQAYATVPETLPSHTSIMTGLYPAGHGVHENGRTLAATVPLLAEHLHQAGYRTSAFVSSFVLARQFGLARGFDLYDDPFGGALQPDADGAQVSERSAEETTRAAMAELDRAAAGPRFIWVHYNDPHAPYAPPEPFKTRYATHPYLGEVAFMDQQLGRLVQAFDRLPGDRVVVVVADHGEGLGEHGEAHHGTLIYQSTMHVPLVIAGPGVAPGTSDTPVSTRRVFFTILDWAGLGSEHSLRSTHSERTADSGSDVVLGESMKPYLEYGWQPQVMAVAGTFKAIEAGKVETYDLAADPRETHDLGGGVSFPPGLRKAMDDYPVPTPSAARVPANLDEAARRRLASLGYVSASAAPVVRKDAPRPADMTGLLETIEKASGLFTAGLYAKAIPLLEQIRTKDPYNLDATLSLATAHSMLGHDAQAVALFEKAAAIAPESPDVRVYLGLHYARTKDVARALPLLKQALADTPDRVAVLEALADIRADQGDFPEAVRLRQRLDGLRTPSGEDLVKMGEEAMETGQTSVATAAFERARTTQGEAFTHDLELGVLYLSAHHFSDARVALDRVPSTSPDYPMALFKRAQVSVLLHEPDAPLRIAAARKRADAETRLLIEQEKLFGQQAVDGRR